MGEKDDVCGERMRRRKSSGTSTVVVVVVVVVAVSTLSICIPSSTGWPQIESIKYYRPSPC